MTMSPNPVPKTFFSLIFLILPFFEHPFQYVEIPTQLPLLSRLSCKQSEYTTFLRWRRLAIHNFQDCAIKSKSRFKQVAQWETIAHLGASIMFGDTIIDDAQRQVTLNLNLLKNIRYYASPGYLQVLKRSE